MTTTFEAVRACSIVLLAGVILHAGDLTAGNGLLVDWRTVRCGETLLESADAFDVARLFVALVGEEAAFTAATRDRDLGPTSPEPRAAVRVHAFAQQPNGGRRRTFEAGPFTVMVEPHEDDAAQAAFAEALAEMAASMRS